MSGAYVQPLEGQVVGTPGVDIPSIEGGVDEGDPLKAEGASEEELSIPLSAVHSTNSRLSPSVRFIELCTVDCSTFLLFPPEHTIEDWFVEFQAASQRVETIAKRRSGALEIAETRRARLLEKECVVCLRILRVVVQTARREKVGSDTKAVDTKEEEVEAGKKQGAEVEDDVDTFGGGEGSKVANEKSSEKAEAPSATM